jgi:hypothetical protein
MFHPQVREKTSTQLGPLERAFLRHWAMDKVDKHSHSECSTHPENYLDLEECRLMECYAVWLL